MPGSVPSPFQAMKISRESLPVDTSAGASLLAMPLRSAGSLHWFPEFNEAKEMSPFFALHASQTTLLPSDTSAGAAAAPEKILLWADQGPPVAPGTSESSGVE